MAKCEHVKLADPERETQRRRLREMPGNRAALGAVAPVSDLRTRRLLRFFPRTACQSTFQRDGPPGDAGFSIRQLEMVL